MNELEQEACQKGHAEAQRDLAAGRFLLFSGAPSESGWGRYLAETMRQRFAVEITFTSCFTSAEESAYRNGYNEEVIGHIDRTFGIGAYALAYSDVQCWRKARYDEWLAANGLTNGDAKIFDIRLEGDLTSDSG